MAITETWFKPDYELKIPGYEGFYSSRRWCKGGGVAIYIDKRLLNKAELISSSSDLLVMSTTCDKYLLLFTTKK